MKIKVKFFFDFQEIIRKKEVEIKIEKKVTIEEFIQILENYFPEIKKITMYPEDYGVLLNSEHAKMTTYLKENDVIDLFSIIDGG
jgi:molybdopterin converting factor small subunit